MSGIAGVVAGVAFFIAGVSAAFLFGMGCAGKCLAFAGGNLLRRALDYLVFGKTAGGFFDGPAGESFLTNFFIFIPAFGGVAVAGDVAAGIIGGAEIARMFQEAGAFGVIKIIFNVATVGAGVALLFAGKIVGGVFGWNFTV